ncbi:MAG: alpha-amylase family glycosyl hydrolase, partial [Cyclobacteriaceae bacterium]|nr:alpha-amylase family glycosyl hydrolase [Cyclobacteriaceae bacterium]
MIKIFNFFTFSLVVVLTSTLFSCTHDTKTEEKNTDSITYIAPDVTYEIFIQSFADSDGNGIGDFTGAASKLDYLKELGIEAIWLMPIMPSPSYHKYDVTDYRNIHPDYGTLEDFKNFVEEAHKRDIQVIIDLVINHSSDKHPWFIEAVANPNSQYRSYYVWANKDSIADQIAKKETTFDSDNITQWHAPNG